jgi:ABC-type multidrug transport system fused ATPase/permease subunit
MPVIASIAIDVAAFSSASKYTLVLIPLFIMFAWGVQYFYLRTSRQITLLELEAKSSIYTHLHESSSGIHHIRAFNWHHSELKRICKLNDMYQKPYYYRLCTEVWLALALDFSVLCIVTLVVTFALCFPGSTTQAATGLSLSKLISFTNFMAILVKSGSNVETSLGSVRRTRKFNKETPVERPIASPATIPCDWPSDGRIEFASVTAKYG